MHGLRLDRIPVYVSWMIPSIRPQLRKGETLYGSIVSLPSPAVAEILSEAGYDWLFIDAEHGALDLGHLTQILQAVGHRIPCIVRVPVAEEASIKRVLDLGASGIIAPQVNCSHAARVLPPVTPHGPAGRYRRLTAMALNSQTTCNMPTNGFR